MAEKSQSIVDEANHGISTHESHFPVVAEGTGKTLDTAAGAKAKQVHNVSPCPRHSKRVLSAPAIMLIILNCLPF